MSQSGKVFLGILTVIPLILAAIIVSSTLGMVFEIIDTVPHNQDPDPFLLFGDMFFLVGLGAVTGVLSLGLLVYYIIHALNNPKLDKNLQLVWLLILIFTNGIGSIIYWYLNIWREEGGQLTHAS